MVQVVVTEGPELARRFIALRGFIPLLIVNVGPSAVVGKLVLRAGHVAAVGAIARQIVPIGRAAGAGGHRGQFIGHVIAIGRARAIVEVLAGQAIGQVVAVGVAGQARA